MFESMFDLIVWLLMMWVIFGGSFKKKKQSKPKQSRELEQNAEEIAEKIRRAEQERKAAAEQRQLQRQNRGRTVIFGDLGTFVREFVDLMTDDEEEFTRKLAEQPAEQDQSVLPQMLRKDIERRKRELIEKSDRRLTETKPQESRVANECEFCTGEAEVESTIAVHSAPAKPIVISDKPNVRDVATACSELGLNPLQQAVVWSEVLDKPLALRKRR